MRASSNVAVGVLAVAGVAMGGCRARESGPRECAPTAIVIHEVGDVGTVEMRVSCSGGGAPLDARIAMSGALLLTLVAPGESAARATGKRSALVAPYGEPLGAGTIALTLDPRSHALEGEVAAHDARVRGHFEGAYRLECRVPASVLNVQENGVAAPGSEAFVRDEAFASVFCRRFAALR